MGPQSYMLKVNETLYEKELTPLAEELLKYASIKVLTHHPSHITHTQKKKKKKRTGGGKGGEEDIRKVAYFSSYADPALLKGPRDKTRVVKYKIPTGTAAKISNNTTRTSRILFGPGLVILDPYEDFNILSLSGKTKKQKKQNKTKQNKTISLTNNKPGKKKKEQTN